MAKDEKMETEVNDGADVRDEATAAPEAAAADDSAALAERVKALAAEAEEHKSALLYARAEAQNMLRRAQKEAEDARTYAATAFARDILSVADNLARALQSIPAELREDEKLKGLVTGLDATGRELDSVFARHGISKIAAVGEALDPNRHQAMMEIPSDAAPGTVVQEIQSGYMIKDRLLRPALVGVAKAAD